jgi:transcriptional regulator with XRE-family HTH domain
VDLALIIKYRLAELGLEQKDLAAAAQVTESYISQLLARKKAPPSADRTEIYARMSLFLGLPEDELSKLADLQRREELKRKVAEPLQPLYRESRELLLRKCANNTRGEVRTIFEKEPFGELERLVTGTFLGIAREIAGEQSQDEGRLALLAQLTERTPGQIRQANLDLLNTDRFDVSVETCAWFLEPLIESWDIDLKSFRLDVVLNRKLVPGGLKRFEYVETTPEQPPALKQGLEEFIADPRLSANVTEEELAFLRTLKLDGRRPTSIYYYRALQNLRDPLHFRPWEQERSSD